MTQLFSDTDLDIETKYIERLRDMSALQRWEAVRSLNRTLLTLMKSDVLSMHPDASEVEVRYYMAVRLYGDEIANRAFSKTAK